tara:strand:- start:33125 stop:35470 length:2346 start_codon:yes stop_codon:yes gene_type:complete
MAESNKQKKQAYIEQINLAEKLKGIVEGTNMENERAIEIAIDLDSKLQDRIKSADGIQKLDEAINELLLEQAKTKTDINQEMIDELTTTRDIMKLEEKRKGLMDDLNDKLKDASGMNNEFVKAFQQGGAIGVGIVATTKAIEYLGDVMNNTVGLAKDLYTNMGTSADEATRLGFQTLGAAISIEGLLYGVEGLSAAAKDAGDFFGTTRGITSQMQKDIAELTALTGDAANSVKLNEIFEQTAQNSSDLTDDIRAIATKEGVNASALFKQMAGSAGLLVGASAEELKNLAKKTAELQRQGVTMAQMEEMSGNLLNIETSLRAEMKVRAMGMDDIAGSAGAFRDAAMAFEFGDEAEGMELMGQALKQAGVDAERFGEMNRKEKEAVAALMGTNVDGLSDMVVKQEQFARLKAENPTMSTEELQALAEADAKTAQIMGKVGSFGLNIGTAFAGAVAQMAIMNKMQGKDMGFKNLIPGMSKKPKIETPKIDGDVDPKKAGGIKSFLTGLRDGLQAFAKGAGKTLLGALTLAGVVAILGVGFAVAMEVLGDVDPVKMLAFSVSMGILGATLSLIANVAGNVIMGALALGIVAVALIPAAYAFSLLENVDVGKMIAFSIMLPLLALAAAGLGFIAPFVIAGAAALMILGLALIPAAMAFGMLGDSGMDGMVESLATLGQVAGPLLMVGAGLISIAAGLGIMGYAGMAALPILGMLLALSVAAPALLALGGALGGIFGGGDEGGDSDVVSELKGLRSDIAGQPIQIVVDGKVISEITRVQRSRQSRAV